MPKVLVQLLAEIARFSFSWPLSSHIVPYYSMAYTRFLYLVAGFQQGENGSCKASYRRGWEFTNHSCHILLVISNQRFKGRKNRLYHLTMEVACMHRNGRNCWHPSLPTIYHRSQSGFRLPSLLITDTHPIIVSASWYLMSNISWSTLDLDLFLRCGFSWSSNLAAQLEKRAWSRNKDEASQHYL